MSRFATLLVVILAIPSVALASSVMRTGEAVSVAADQAVEGDFYGLGNDVTVSGEVTDDLLVIAGKVKVNGKTGADLAALAGDVQIDGVIGGDARIVAGEVTVAGEVQGDLVVLAGTLKVLSTAKISGDIDVKTGTLTLGERADITGMVKYASSNEIVRAQNARVAGQVIQNETVVEVASPKDVLVPLLVLLFAALVWHLLFGRLLDRVSTQVVVHPLRSMMIGFGLFFLIPIAVGILIVSQLGSLLGITLVFAYFALLFAAVTISGVVAGTYLFTLVSPKRATGIPSVLFGTSVVFLFLFIPVIGPVLCIALILTTMGALATHLYRTIRFS